MHALRIFEEHVCDEKKTVAVFKKGISGFEEYNLPLF